jgi:hypothetical protein
MVKYKKIINYLCIIDFSIVLFLIVFIIPSFNYPKNFVDKAIISKNINDINHAINLINNLSQISKNISFFCLIFLLLNALCLLFFIVNNKKNIITLV